MIWKFSFVIPKNSNIGLVIHADVEPVIAKTTNIIINWKFEVMPQRSFKLAISYL